MIDIEVPGDSRVVKKEEKTLKSMKNYMARDKEDEKGGSCPCSSSWCSRSSEQEVRDVDREIGDKDQDGIDSEHIALLGTARILRRVLNT